LTHEPPGVPADDDPIPDELPLYRLVKTTQCKPTDGSWELTPLAFCNPSNSDEMSVILRDTLEALGRDTGDLPERTFPADPELWGVAVIEETRFLRDEEEQEVRRSRTETERAHGDVCGHKGGGRRKRIWRRAEWVFPPPTPPS
jgi:hypothetical protein